MELYVVYKHTCPSGKVYIGITSKPVARRWRNNGDGYKTHTHFYRAIKKYGWDNIKHEILCSGLTKAEAEAKEIELIAENKSNDPKYGYNVSAGGHLNKNALGHKLSEEAKRQIGLTKRGNKYRVGVKASNTTRQKMRENARRLKYTPPERSRAVVQFTTNGEFVREYKNIKEAHTYNNCSHISDCCKGKRKTVAGYVWKYAEAVQ